LLEERGKIRDFESDLNKIETVLKDEEGKRYKQLAQLFPTIIRGSSTIFLSFKTTE
jgi:hypothetical protein